MISKSTTSDLGLALIRAMLAAVFVYHGSQKLFGAFGGPGIDGFAGFLATLGVPFPGLGAVLAGAAELGGGLALAAGLLVRWAAVPLVFTMLVGAFTAHTGFDAQAGGMEYPLTLAAVVAGLALVGPGAWTAAGLLRRLGRRSTPTAPARAPVAA